MDDLISRQAAIENLEMLHRDARDDASYMLIGYNHALSDMRAILKSLPPAQPERKIGKWVKWGSRYKCNQCNLTNEYKKPFCPNCGAKMDEVE